MSQEELIAIVADSFARIAESGALDRSLTEITGNLIDRGEIVDVEYESER
jgi:hypothetical protein